MVMVIYEYQKLDANPLNTTVKKAWENRNGKNYYALDEKISSIFYLAPSFITKKYPLIMMDTQVVLKLWMRIKQ